MKKTGFILAALMVTTGALADGTDYLALRTTGGTVSTLTAVGLEITFADGQLVASNATTGEHATLPLADLSTMYFTDKPGATAVETPSDQATWGLAEADAVFDLAGRQLRPEGLRTGVYVIRKDNETKKIWIP